MEKAAIPDLQLAIMGLVKPFQAPNVRQQEQRKLSQ